MFTATTIALSASEKLQLCTDMRIPVAAVVSWLLSKEYIYCCAYDIAGSFDLSNVNCLELIWNNDRKMSGYVIVNTKPLVGFFYQKFYLLPEKILCSIFLRIDIISESKPVFTFFCIV